MITNRKVIDILNNLENEHNNQLTEEYLFMNNKLLLLSKDSNNQSYGTEVSRILKTLPNIICDPSSSAPPPTNLPTSLSGLNVGGSLKLEN